MSILIKERNDILHEVIFDLSETTQDVKFPVRRIVNYLIEEGYIKNDLESSDHSISLVKGGSKALVTELAVSFEKLSSSDRSKYYQQFNTYIISSSKIFLQSAIQNNKASIVNLIQNQRRTCISNMYYAIHNGFAAMIEYYKSEYLISEQVRNEISSENDDEMRLGHFTPHALEAFLNNLDMIISTPKENLEQLLIDSNLGTNRMESYENPFTWIFPLFFDVICDSEFTQIINDMDSALKIIDLQKYGADEGHRRFNFEMQIKKCITKVLEISRENTNDLKKNCAILGGYLGFAYMLRQSADYDVLFDVKIQQQEIISWAFITSKFTKIVTKYIKEEVSEGSIFEKLDAASSTEILLNEHNGSSIMTVIGIIQKRDFSLVELIKKLYTITGYKIVDQQGRVPELSTETETMTICRILFGTPLECFICISKEGLFRIDISYNRNSDTSEFIKHINYYYLEQLIDEEIIASDLLLPDATIVRGLPTYSQASSVNYIDLVMGVHDMVRFRISRDIRNYLENISQVKSTTDLTICSIFSRRNFESERGFLRREIERSLLRHERTSENKILIVIFTPYNVTAENQQHLFDVITKSRYFNVSFDLSIEFVHLTEQEIKQLIQRNYTKLDMSIDNLIKEFNQSKEPNDDNPSETHHLDSIDSRIDDSEDSNTDDVEDAE